MFSVIAGFQVSRMLVCSSVMISALATRRLRMDTAMSGSGMDLYHSSGWRVSDSLCAGVWFTISP